MSNFPENMEKNMEFSIFSGKFDIFVTKFYHLFVMFMNLIGFVIENLSYNWSIITYRNSNTNAVRVFHCIKIIYGTFHLEGTCDLEGLCFCWILFLDIYYIRHLYLSIPSTTYLPAYLTYLPIKIF